MPIVGQLQNEAFAPDDIAKLTTAFESCLRELGLNDRDDPLVLSVAAEIIRLGKQGMRDPDQLRHSVMSKFEPYRGPG